MAQTTQPSLKRIVEALSEDQSENAWGNAAAGFIRTLEGQAKPGGTMPTDERVLLVAMIELIACSATFTGMPAAMLLKHVANGIEYGLAPHLLGPRMDELFTNELDGPLEFDWQSELEDASVMSVIRAWDESAADSSQAG